MDHQVCVTKNRMITCRFSWVINHFKLLNENKLFSSKFICPDDGDLQWQLKLSMSIFHQDRLPKILLGRYFTAQEYLRDICVEAKYEITIGTSFKHSGTSECEYLANADEFNMLFSGYNLKRPSTVSAHDQFVIHCEVVYLAKDLPQTTLEPNEAAQPYTSDKLKDVAALLYENRSYADMILIASGKEFKVHTVVLVAQSEVFRAMFQYDTKEMQRGRVEIDDIKPDVLEALLYFVYTGKEPTNLAQVVEGVLAAADKYIIGQVKDLAEHNLGLSLSVDNVAKRLILAEQHSATKLKAKAIAFIAARVTDVMKTEGWKELVQKFAKLVEEIFTALI